MRAYVYTSAFTSTTILEMAVRAARTTIIQREQRVRSRKRVRRALNRAYKIHTHTHTQLHTYTYHFVVSYHASRHIRSTRPLSLAFRVFFAESAALSPAPLPGILVNAATILHPSPSSLMLHFTLFLRPTVILNIRSRFKRRD